MKTCLIWIAAALATVAGSRGYAGAPDSDEPSYFTVPTEENTKNLDGIMKAYISSLGNDNQGVVESALAHVAYIAIWMPENRFEKVQARVRELAEEGSIPTLRFKAYLADMALSSPRLFAHVRWTTFQDDEEFYAALSRTLQVSLLGYGKAE